ncbi:MAG TPA: efflux RND transporter periplasmic adaptor subunit [Syntrophales bacterium]|nr:efflux RND transporter periplasmic adaptor subunit [Syntrophales bacterium]
MKKLYYFAAVCLCLAVAYLAGYWSNSPVGTKSGTPATASQTRVAGGQIEASVSEDAFPPGTVKVSPDKLQIMGVRLGTAERNSETHTLRLLGRVVSDETRVYQIIAAVDGRITQSSIRNSTGSLVKKDEPLASFYTPEFFSAQQAYIYQLNQMDRLQAREKENPQLKANIQQYIDTLRNLGMDDIQIAEITRTRQRAVDIVIHAPVPGFIVARNITPDQKFSKGTELFKIADLRRVWIIADLYENEAQYLKPGKIVKATLPNQKKVFEAKVSSTLPLFDPATRTLKVRLEADNPGYFLRPDMFVDVELPITFPPAVVVPADAVLDSGLKKTVFVDRGKGFFEPRQVETGWRFGNKVEIVKGLEPGERIVVSGNFLIDSESRTELALSGISGTIARDPVCKTDVSVRKAEKAGMKSVHRGQAYYFSSEECKRKFEQDPDRYVKQSVE